MLISTNYDMAAHSLLSNFAHTPIMSNLGYRAPHNFDPIHWEYGFMRSPVPTAILTTEDKFEYVNEAFSVLLGYSRAELENQEYSKIVHPQDHRGHQIMVKKILGGEQNQYTAQKRYLSKFGKVITVYIYISLVRNTPDYFYVHVLPVEVFDTLVKEGHIEKPTRTSRPFGKDWLVNQISDKWLTFLLLVGSLILSLVALYVDFNKTKWELQQLKNVIENEHNSEKKERERTAAPTPN